MSVQELSAQMGISLPKAYELVKTPGFPTLRIGTRILIPIDAYKEWLMKQSTGKCSVTSPQASLWTPTPMSPPRHKKKRHKQ